MRPFGWAVISAVFCVAGIWPAPVAAAGPYAPAAGQEGSTALPMPVDANDTSIFVAWADGCCCYHPGEHVDRLWQDPNRALGPPAGLSYDVVSLGRGGDITVTFSRPITDGPGWDFATFENSFNDTFLELGYVEVSSDGINFFRFDNFSETPGPVAGSVDPTNITGYCSKYRQGFGTPFDLNELADREGLNIHAVTHVRIVDIVGDGTNTDTAGNPIYDPYPTIGSAGVDVDAVGVIHQLVLTADFSGNNFVNLEDFALLAAALASEPGMESWNPNCDIAQPPDGVINIDDFIVFMDQWLTGTSVTE